MKINTELLTEIKAPQNFHQLKNQSCFLAGSIEMGTATQWQKQVVSKLKNEDVTILNPRRDDWDSTWEQNISNPQFRQQVEWELEAMECADVIAMYFDPKAKSPITLLELGLFAKSKKLIVCCPEGYWRKGNVDVVCSKYHIPNTVNFSEFFSLIKFQLEIVQKDKKA
ncbi:nucleoside 2-deoxyribosyltransferase domain-containing protein [Candidatus Bathyarchaeota archaeon]|nr:nucleoside 2-deoxyribosyltransferase domain-containing protein [Candidatus Bathyarchaeota archaeon]